MDLSKPTKLIKEIQTSGFLPYYNDELIQEILNDIKKMYEKMSQILKTRLTENSQERSQEYNSIQAHILTINSYIRRCKRCVLAYINRRLEKIHDAVWTFWNIPQEYAQFFTNDEKEYLKNYQDALLNYQQSFPLDLDLTKDLEPPKDLFIEVKVQQDCGEIVTLESGVIKLSKNTIVYVKRSDVEHLIRQGLIFPTGN